MVKSPNQPWAEVWSFGVTVWKHLLNKLPFEDTYFPQYGSTFPIISPACWAKTSLGANSTPTVLTSTIIAAVRFIVGGKRWEQPLLLPICNSPTPPLHQARPPHGLASRHEVWKLRGATKLCAVIPVKIIESTKTRRRHRFTVDNPAPLQKRLKRQRHTHTHTTPSPSLYDGVSIQRRYKHICLPTGSPTGVSDEAHRSL